MGNALQKMFERESVPRKLQMDEGKAFLNSPVQGQLKVMNVLYFTTDTSFKPALAERLH